MNHTTDEQRAAFEREYNRIWANSRRAILQENGRYNSLCADRSLKLWQAAIAHDRGRGQYPNIERKKNEKLIDQQAVIERLTHDLAECRASLHAAPGAEAKQQPEGGKDE